MNQMMIDETVLNDLLGRAVVDIGATMAAPLILLGDRLGLFTALAEQPLTSAELAERTGTNERYVREWLRTQAAGGYVTFDAVADRYSLSAEQALLFADEDSPAFVVGGFQTALGAARIEPRLLDTFRTGGGIGWHEHHDDLFHGCERFFRPGYMANLAASWIPALDGVGERLRRGGARTADVGCGHGASTLLMARAYPDSTFTGFDYHAESIAAARQRAAAAGAPNAFFEVASAKSFPGGGYDLVTTFDALHDMGDPVGAAAHVLGTLARDGAWMIVEPRASDRVEENLNPVGRTFYAASTLVCTPGSLSQEVGLALGAQAGEARIREVVTAAGFTRFRRAAETPINSVYEARP